MSVDDFLGLQDNNVVSINSTSDVLTLTPDQVSCLRDVTCSAGDRVTMEDTGAELGRMSDNFINAIKANGIDIINATDDSIRLSHEAARAIASSEMSFSPEDAVTINSTRVDIGFSAEEIRELSAKGFDAIFLMANGENIVEQSLDASQAKAIADTGIVLTGDQGTGTVTVTVRDEGENFADLSADDLAKLVANRINVIEVTGGKLVLTWDKYSAIKEIALQGQGTVTLEVSLAELEDLTAEDIAAIKAGGIGTVTLVETGQVLASLSDAAMEEFIVKGVDAIDASDDVLDLSLEQFRTVGMLPFTHSDALTLSVTKAELDGLEDTQIQSYKLSGVDFLVLKDAGAAFGAFTATQLDALSARGIDRLDAADDRFTLSMEQYAALGSLQLSEADTVTLSGAGDALSALTAGGLAIMAAKGIDELDASDNRLTLSMEQYAALGSLKLTASDTVALSGTGATLAGLSAGQISSLAARGIDVLDASDGRLTLSMEQYAALGSLQLSEADTVTLSGTGASLAGLSAAQISALAAKGVDMFDARTGNSYTLSLAQYGALGGMMLSGDDSVTILADRDAALTNGGTNLTLTGTAVRGTGNELSNTITGTATNNVLRGMDGDDTIDGGAGKDTLFGGAGRDLFVFDTKPNKKKNLDKISDFKAKDDAIWLDNKIFKKLGKAGSEAAPAKLKKAFFKIGDEAKDKNDYLIYNKAKGVLSYDADGSGSGRAIEIAEFKKKTAVTANDFFVI
ncbi:calcium-binding protein [Microvirga splendida]|uniref:Calcium-binding protein n=1 Tax=Microvirga splendida TaxID=2795727 RepID=A0ABS0Y663_9HYPH|nr:calcium-binding protein [Microvirga splendida]MBJ6127786.1 calcium-binding protein [Microvirga splendida]